jgi:hypothetical protein
MILISGLLVLAAIVGLVVFAFGVGICNHVVGREVPTVSFT